MTDADPGWRRLDLRTLITRPVNAWWESALLTVGTIFGITAFVGYRIATPATIVVLLAAAVLPWATTRYRMTDSHLEVRRGLFNRASVTVRLSRVRTVDVETDLIHRLLGVTGVVIGTAAEEQQIELDAVTHAESQRLRSVILSLTDAPPIPGPDVATDEHPDEHSDVLAVHDWSWLRFAPLNAGNLWLVGIGLGITALYGPTDLLVINFSGLRDSLGVSWGVFVAGIVIAAALAWTIATCAGYAAWWAGLRLVREPGDDGPRLRRERNALTRQVTTVDEAKIRGVVIGRRNIVGLAGGADLHVLTTGLDADETQLLPSAPRRVVEDVASVVITDRAAVTGRVESHGRRARTQLYLRHLGGAAVIIAYFAVEELVLEAVAGHAVNVLPGLPFSPDEPGNLLLTEVVVALSAIPLTLLIAELRYRLLGHTLTDRHLVAATGTISSVRTVLQTDGIVGWRIHQSPLDRARGLAKLTATTAAGTGAVLVPDVSLEQAVALAAAATPETVGEFLEHADDHR